MDWVSGAFNKERMRMRMNKEGVSLFEGCYKMWESWQIPALQFPHHRCRPLQVLAVRSFFRSSALLLLVRSQSAPAMQSQGFSRIKCRGDSPCHRHLLRFLPTAAESPFLACRIRCNGQNVHFYKLSLQMLRLSSNTNWLKRFCDHDVNIGLSIRSDEFWNLSLFYC